jgi:CRP/FNR family transcriptional regulator, dissimilatory nitrate respiration regulator
VPTAVEDVLRSSTTFRRLNQDDRQRLAAVTRTRQYPKGETIFGEGDPSDHFFTIASGRVKVFKTTPAGKDIILEVFGTGDPLGATAAYEGRPFPASAVALEETTCILIPRTAFFALLEQHPSLVRGLLLGLTHRLIELTNRLAELSGGRVEARFARLFLKLGQDIGRTADAGVFIPMTLTRQELADMTGTTIETCIRIMSRWGKEEIVRTEKEGFTLLDKHSLEAIGST